MTSDASVRFDKCSRTSTAVLIRMRFGGRQNADSESFGEMARLAQSPGTEKADLVRGAVQSLLAASEVDRAGVWIDAGEIDARSSRAWSVLRGQVSDRSGDDAPSDWARLSLGG